MNPAMNCQPATDRESFLLPPVDVLEDSQGITLYADMPGVPKDKLQVRVEGDELQIEGELVLPTPQGLKPSHVEVGLSRYRRRFTLSKELNGDAISAELTQGVLRVRIPKAAHAQPRQVEVKIA